MRAFLAGCHKPAQRFSSAPTSSPYFQPVPSAFNLYHCTHCALHGFQLTDFMLTAMLSIIWFTFGCCQCLQGMWQLTPYQPLRGEGTPAVILHPLQIGPGSELITIVCNAMCAGSECAPPGRHPAWGDLCAPAHQPSSLSPGSASTTAGPARLPPGCTGQPHLPLHHRYHRHCHCTLICRYVTVITIIVIVRFSYGTNLQLENLKILTDASMPSHQEPKLISCC